MVVAPQAIAADIGSEVLARGGNAVDAAVTTAFAQGVLDPLNCGIGGFGSMVAYSARSGSWRALSFHGRAGALVRENMWEGLVEEEYERGGDGFRLRGYVNDVGYRSIATPGTVAGLSSALAEMGSVDWATALEPAAPLALDGYRVTPKARALFRRSALDVGLHPAARGTATPATSAIFTRDGHSLWEIGDLFVQEDYGNTLLRLSRSGPEEFYRGELAEQIVADITAGGGFVTAEDLRGYAAEWTEPLVGHYRGYSVITAPPPASGLTLVQMLQIVERFDLAKMGHNSPDHLAVLAGAMRSATRDRVLHLADPAFFPVPVDELLSDERADQAYKAIEAGEEIPVPRWLPPDTGTTHVSVADQYGNLVALTHTLGAASGVVTPGLGFQYNNAMNCFNPFPHRPNSIAPGKARAGGIAPTVLDNGRGSKIVIGAPGGAKIANAILQVIINIVDFGMSAVEAVSATRIDCQGQAIEVEARLAQKTCEVLAQRGNEVFKSAAAYWDYPLVHAIVVDASTGGLDGGADPRGEGAALIG
jgi:gamma-glutamyltranspeptidase / glutathione hydrolase